MKKFVLAPVLAALAMFVWGFLFWGMPHNLPYKVLGTVADESAVAAGIGQLLPASGAYLIPNPLLGEARMAELMKRGPSVEVHIRKQSLESMDPAVLVRGFLFYLVLAVVLTVMLCGLEKSFERWTCRVKFCAFLGVLDGICQLSPAVWEGHAWGWTMMSSIYGFLMYVIAGLVLAKFVTPKTVA